MADTRSNWVDTARGLGIVLVVFGHVQRGLVQAGLPFNRAYFDVSDATLYSFHMPLFFFLSGLFFLSSWDRHGSGRFVAQKLSTLVYPYVLWSLLQGFLEVAASPYTNKHASVQQVLSLLWHPRQQFWFLYALVFIFLAGMALYTALPRRAAAFALLLALTAFFFSHSVPNIGPLYYVAAYSVFFIAGTVPGAKRIAADSAWLLSGAIVAFIGIQYVYQTQTDQGGDFASLLASLGAAITGITASCCAAAILARRGDRVLAYLGRASLGIFLMHTIFASGLRILLQHFLGVTSTPVHLALGLLIGLCAPVLVMELAQRWNIQGLLRAPSFSVAGLRRSS